MLNRPSNRATTVTIDTQISTHISRATFADIMDPNFYKKESCFDEVMERLFKIKSRETTVTLEIYYGVIHFISCFYCLAVIPQQMSKAGYNTTSTFVATAACAGFGSIILGLFANLPFVMAPPTVVTIFFSIFMQNNESSFENNVTNVGSSGVLISGALLILMGFRPVGNFIGRLIPYSLQAGTAIGIGLLTALAGMTDVNYVTTGSNGELLRLGSVTFEVGVAIAGVIIICIAQWYHVKGSFCIAIIICSIVYNFYNHGWPDGIYTQPNSVRFQFIGFQNNHVPLMVADLLFLYILYLNGLISSLSYLAGLTRDDGAIPRGRWVFMLSGIVTMASAMLTGAPVLISPESAAAIKEGAKTGLSAIICGFLFLASVLFAPIFESIPSAGTAPILFMIGVLLFQNVLRVDWKNVADATPAFVVLFFIPFSFSVVQGVLVGYVVYLTVGILTGTFFINLAVMAHIYFPIWATKVGLALPKRFNFIRKHGEDDDAGFDDDNDGNYDEEYASQRNSSCEQGPKLNPVDVNNPVRSPRQSHDSHASSHSITNMINRVIFSAELDHRAQEDIERTASHEHHIPTRSRRRTLTVGARGDGSEYMSMGFEGDHLFDLALLKLQNKGKTGNDSIEHPDSNSNFTAENLHNRTIRNPVLSNDTGSIFSHSSASASHTVTAEGSQAVDSKHQSNNNINNNASATTNSSARESQASRSRISVGASSSHLNDNLVENDHNSNEKL